MTTPGLTDRGPQSIYTGRVTNWLMVAVCGALLVPLVALSKTPDGSWLDLAFPALLAAIGVLLEVLTGSSVRTAAGPNGVAARLGVLGWPRRTYVMEEIERVDIVELRAWSVAYGFWWTPRSTHYTVRSGPTLRLMLRNGRRVMISVANAEVASSVVQDALSTSET